jgi:ABC-2 type transport system ATP-binding protein
MPHNSNALAIERLSKTFGEFRAVQEVSLAVHAGEIVALLGPNGAGKTTTLRMLMGILQPSGGTARIAGLDCFADRVEAKRRVGYLPDEPAFYDYLRGRELLAFVASMHGVPAAEAEARNRPLIERLDLGDALEDYAVNYSRGMKKKLALICALVHDPLLLILDEPTSGLDPIACRVVRELLREKAAAGHAVFYSTHILSEAEALCQRVAILMKGRVAACGELADLRADLAPGGSLEDIFFAVAAKSEGEGEPEAAGAGPGTGAAGEGPRA